MTISGTALGSSGSVSFNGVAAAVQSWSNTSVTTQVPSGATTGQVVLTTSGTQTGGINFQVLPPPNPLSSVTIQPATASLVVGETRTLLAVDNNGITITAATWSVDNTGLASISNDTPPVLTASATGTITLTATYQGVPGQATWTIVSGALQPGTPQWTLAADGLNLSQAVGAIPTPGGADLFVIEGPTPDSVPWFEVSILMEDLCGRLPL